MEKQIPNHVLNCKSRLDMHSKQDNSQEPLDPKYPICFKCNALSPYCVCEVYFPKRQDPLIKYVAIGLAFYATAVTYLLHLSR